MNTRSLRAHRPKPLLAGAAALALAGTFLLAGFGGSPVASSDRFWSSLWTNGTFRTFPDAGLAAAASDVVVVGRIESVEQGRSVTAAPDLGNDGVLSFARAHVKVENVLAGSYVPGPDGDLALELFLPRPAALADMQASTPPERTLMFLRLSPSGGSNVYALLNPETILRDIAGSRTVEWVEEPWLTALKDLPFETIVELVRAEP